MNQSDIAPSQIDLRRTESTDDDFLYSLYCSTRQEEIAAWGWSAPQADMFLKMQFRALQHNYRSQPEITDDRIVLAECAPIGRLIVFRTAKEICLADIALLPEFRSRGVGTHLIRDLIVEGDTTCRPVTLHVEKNNQGAARLYRKLGFEVTADTGLHFKMERKIDGREDAATLHT